MAYRVPSYYQYSAIIEAPSRAGHGASTSEERKRTTKFRMYDQPGEDFEASQNDEMQQTRPDFRRKGKSHDIQAPASKGFLKFFEVLQRTGAVNKEFNTEEVAQFMYKAMGENERNGYRTMALHDSPRQ